MNKRNQFTWKILWNLIRGAVLFASLTPSTPGCAQSSEFDGVDDAEGRRVMQQAHQQIEEYRKGDFALTLLDEAGRQCLPHPRNGPLRPAGGIAVVQPRILDEAVGLETRCLSA